MYVEQPPLAPPVTSIQLTSHQQVVYGDFIYAGRHPMLRYTYGGRVIALPQQLYR